MTEDKSGQGATILKENFGFSNSGQFDNSETAAQQLEDWLKQNGVSEQEAKRIKEHELAHGQTDHPGQGYYQGEIAKVKSGGKPSTYAGGAYVAEGENRPLTHDYLISTAPKDMGYDDKQHARLIRQKLKNMVESTAPSHSTTLPQIEVNNKKNKIIDKIKSL